WLVWMMSLVPTVGLSLLMLFIPRKAYRPTAFRVPMRRQVVAAPAVASARPVASAPPSPVRPAVRMTPKQEVEEWISGSFRLKWDANLFPEPGDRPGVRAQAKLSAGSMV